MHPFGMRKDKRNADILLTIKLIKMMHVAEKTNYSDFTPFTFIQIIIEIRMNVIQEHHLSEHYYLNRVFHKHTKLALCVKF